MRRRKNKIALLLILVVTGFSLFVTWPGNPDRYLPDFIPWPGGTGLNIGNLDRDEFRLGLDLAGGVSVTLEAAGESIKVNPGESLIEFSRRNDVDMSLVVDLNNDLEEIDSSEYRQSLPNEIKIINIPLNLDEEFLQEALEEARLIIENRVNGFGVSEAEVTLIGKSRINVQIPGVTAAQAADLVGSTALLEFRELDPIAPFVPPPISLVHLAGVLDDVFSPILRGEEISESPRIIDYPVIGDDDDDVIVVNNSRWQAARGRTGEQLTGRFLVADSIGRVLDSQGEPALAFSFNEDGAKLMKEVTSRLYVSQQPLGIFIDENLISSPVVNAIISESGIISGLSEDQTKSLRRQLRAGALPINFEIIQQTEVAATLGEDSVADTVQAGLVAFLAVIIFMILYYRIPGLLAALSLFIYVALVMTTFKLVPVTLTLAGIAGFILSVGLAVDANILIFERMKEELRRGRSLQRSIDVAWARAWPAIRDANVSTFITVAILWFFADQLNANLIKSFAIALLIGTAFSMLSAILITRTFLNLTVSLGLSRKPWLFGIRYLPTTEISTDRNGRASPSSGKRIEDEVRHD